MDSIKRWLKKLNQPLLQPKCTEHFEIALSTKKFHSRLFRICLYLGIQTYLSYSFIPLLRDESSKLTQGWFPFDWRKSPNYEIIYVFQNFVALWNTLVCLTLDTFSASMISQIGSQCDCLCVTLNHLDTFHLEGGSLLKNDEANVSLLERQHTFFSQMMTNNLIVCIEHYQVIKG
ncbi:hypothetical protein JTB14_031246 [Gonioctena quinquepunctata]|nr:hypothetical protein JTB14_031246 [Gonioctena quinquepunctata]